MAKANNKAKAQGVAKPTGQTPVVQLVERVVTQEDLDRNPELLEAGVQVGETIQVEVSNQEATPNEESKPAMKAKAQVYTVVKSFRDKNDFDTVYKEGDDVSHLESDRLEHLLNIGYVNNK